MKQLALLFLAALAAACGKPSDLRPMQEESNGLVKAYEERVTALATRATDLRRRGDQVQQRGGWEAASKQLEETLTVLLPKMQRAVREAPAKIQRTVSDTQKSEAQKLAELRAFTYQVRTELDLDWGRANGKLDQVALWVSRAEHQARVAAVTPPGPGATAVPPSTEPPPAPTPEPTPEAPASVQ